MKSSVAEHPLVTRARRAAQDLYFRGLLIRIHKLTLNDVIMDVLTGDPRFLPICREIADRRYSGLQDTKPDEIDLSAWQEFLTRLAKDPRTRMLLEEASIPVHFDGREVEGTGLRRVLEWAARILKNITGNEGELRNAATALILSIGAALGIGSLGGIAFELRMLNQSVSQLAPAPTTNNTTNISDPGKQKPGAKDSGISPVSSSPSPTPDQVADLQKNVNELALRLKLLQATTDQQTQDAQALAKELAEQKDKSAVLSQELTDSRTEFNSELDHFWKTYNAHLGSGLDKDLKQQIADLTLAIKDIDDLAKDNLKSKNDSVQRNVRTSLDEIAKSLTGAIVGPSKDGFNTGPVLAVNSSLTKIESELSQFGLDLTAFSERHYEPQLFFKQLTLLKGKPEILKHHGTKVKPDPCELSITFLSASSTQVNITVKGCEATAEQQVAVTRQRRPLPGTDLEVWFEEPHREKRSWSPRTWIGAADGATISVFAPKSKESSWE